MKGFKKKLKTSGTSNFDHLLTLEIHFYIFLPRFHQLLFRTTNFNSPFIFNFLIFIALPYVHKPFPIFYILNNSFSFFANMIHHFINYNKKLNIFLFLRSCTKLKRERNEEEKLLLFTPLLVFFSLRMKFVVCILNLSRDLLELIAYRFSSWVLKKKKNLDMA